jgi:dTDP-4-dehydrorhamnose 3,5-epimerase
MEIRSTSIHGVHVLVPIVHRDHRGWFHRSFDDDVLAEAGLPVHWPQHNSSLSRRGVVRGMHVRVGQGESKIVRCEHGAIDDVVVDVRPGSPTFLRQERFRLDDELHHQLLLPPGVAHGYQALTDAALVCYLHSARYVAEEERAFRHDDPELGIAWAVRPVVTSDRDAAAPTLAEFLAS